MTKGANLRKNAKCKHGFCSPMGNSAWCDFNKDRTIIQLPERCHNPKCNCQKQFTFTPKQYMLEGNGFKKPLKKIFEKSRAAWNKNMKPALNIVSTYIGTAVSARTRNPQIGKATSDHLKSISGGKILSLTDMHGHGFRLKVG